MKYVLITGAYGGMGRKTVDLFKDKGFTVFALDRKVGEKEDGVIPLEVDVTDENTIIAAYEKVKNVTDNLFAIIHFAGVYLLDSLVEIDSERYKKAFEINVFGAFTVNKIFRPLLVKDSRIVITTSELAPLKPLPFTGIYAVTKSALDKYAYSLKMELQLSDIYVSVLRAGAVDTGMIGASTAALDDFCTNTKLYTCNSKRFKKIVDSVESKKIPPQKIANKVYKIISKKKPRFGYKINRNPLLLLLNVLPESWQFKIIKKVLK